jgi:NADH:ubiquinone oxidoreductase subunit F (NADH-binding)
MLSAPALPAETLLGRIEAAGLRGRGGAGFPLARKLCAVRDAGQAAGRAPVAVANGEEGEPGSVKDRYLLRRRPHDILDGLLIASHAAGAGQAYVYVSDAESAEVIAAAIGTRADPLPIEVVAVEHAYVAGEESAVVRRIDGGPALPTAKPPRPFERGVGGAPTLVSNVETLARLAAAMRGERTDRLLLTVSGAGLPPRLYEVPEGMPLGELVRHHLDAPLRGVMLGGLAGGIHSPAILRTPLSFDSLAAAGAALGCGAIHLIGPGGCPVAAVRDALSYLAGQSARQCGVCVTGTSRLAATMARAAQGAVTDADREALERWAVMLPGRGACGLLDAAARLAGSLAANFPGTLAGHAAGSCPACACEPGSIAVPVVPQTPEKVPTCT